MSDVLVLGATGFTGRLVTKELNAHRDRRSFTFALGARSSTKLGSLVSELDLNAQVPLVIVDVTDKDSVERAVKNARVVINTVGPYWKWGTLVVRACVRNGVHYVDLTGEVPWVQDIILKFDYLASKTHSTIVPGCGFDSIPSDLSVYLSVQTLKQHFGSGTEVGRSVTAHSVKGGISGGTLSTMYTAITEIPRSKLRAAFQDHVLSPAVGNSSPSHKLVYSLPQVRPRVFGAFVPLSSVNRAVILRTRGLLETQPSMRHAAYGPKFNYEEFITFPNRFLCALVSFSIFGVSLILANSKIVQWLFKKYIVDKTHGPSDEEMEKGYLHTTNVTTSVPDSSVTSEVHAKSVIKIRGDPGYLVTCVMLAECAIALLDTSKLTPLAREGGVLTPVTAFGDELVKRLEETGRFQFESSILGP